MICGPPDVINPIIAQINVTADCSNIASLPPISFSINGLDYPLTAREYVVQIQGTCQLGVIAFDAGEGLLPIWILGDTFLRRYYAVFDRGNNVVQFANSTGERATFTLPDGTIW